MTSFRAAVICLVLASCGLAPTPGLEGDPPTAHGRTEVPALTSAPPTAVALPPTVAAAPVDRRMARSCTAGTLSSATVRIAGTVPGYTEQGLFTLVRNADHSLTLNRLNGDGCGLSSWLEWNYNPILVTDTRLSASGSNVFISESNHLQEINHRRCGESRLGPFRGSDFAFAPDGLTMTVNSCSQWFAKTRQELGEWSDDTDLTTAALAVSGAQRMLALSGRRVLVLGDGGAAAVVGATESGMGVLAEYNLSVEGEAPRPDNVEVCGLDALCVIYPGLNAAALFTGGQLRDAVAVEGLAAGEWVQQLAFEGESTGHLWVLVNGPLGARLASTH